MMPEYNVVIENRSYKVELAKKEGEGLFEAKVNGKPVEVELDKDVQATSPLTVKVGGKTYEVELEKIERRVPFSVKVNNVRFNAKLRETTRKMTAPTAAVRIAAKRARGRAVVPEEGVVVAPMAGKIVSVKVKKDDVVKAGDVVCVLEAMKMENEITATKGGKVQEVKVAEGTPVNEGDILVVIG